MPSAVEIVGTERTDVGWYATLRCGTVEAFVSATAHGARVVQTSNATHRAFRGAGRRFPSLVAAAGAYRSPAMRAIVVAACAELGIAGGAA